MTVITVPEKWTIHYTTTSEKLMKLSTETISILKNFATINSNIVIQAGNVVQTISEAKNIYARATIQESFPAEFGIYDLGEFLSVLSLFDSPVLDFSEKFVTIREDGKSRKVKYFFSDVDILTHPSKSINMPPADCEFTLTVDMISTIRKAAGTLGVTDIVLEKGETGVEVSVTDLKNPTANSYSIEIDDISVDPDTKIVYNIGYWKMIQSDYKVKISSKLISQFVGDTVEYFIALEKSSSFK